MCQDQGWLTNNKSRVAILHRIPDASDRGRLFFRYALSVRVMDLRAKSGWRVVVHELDNETRDCWDEFEATWLNATRSPDRKCENHFVLNVLSLEAECSLTTSTLLGQMVLPDLSCLGPEWRGDFERLASSIAA